MSELNLPSGWVETTLGNALISVVGGGTPSRKVPAYFSGRIPWFTVKDMKALKPNDAEEHISEAAIADSATNLIPANTLIVATRITLGRAMRPTVVCAINQDLKALVLGRGINPDFLLHWVGANQRVIQDLGSGTTVSGIRLEALHGLPLLLPPSAEQTRIVAKLEELLSDLDAGVAELKAAQKKLAQYRQSLLKAAVEGALTAEWRKQQQAPLSPRGRGAGGEGANTPETDTWFRDRARELRKAQTPAEHDLWQQLRAKRFSGFKFRRQQVIGNYIVDFVCFDQKLVIELDGSQHAEAKERDESRDRWLSEQGFRVLRFWNNEWMAQAESVLETIWSALHKQPPLPNPSPTRGEGLDVPFSLDGLGGESETGAQLLERILTERRARWEAKQLAKFAAQGKTPPKDWQNKYPEPVPPDITDLPELPEGWVWASLDQLAEFITSGSRGWADYYSDAGATFIRSQNINKDWLDLSDIAFVNPPKNSEGARTRVQLHDLLLTITGANVGKAAHVNVELEDAYVSQHVALIRPVEKMLADFLHLFLIASAGGRGILDKKAYGAGKPGLNLQQVGSVVVPLSGNNEMQTLMDTVTAYLTAVSEQEQAIIRSLKQSTAQRQNILRAAFSGQLVPQDPADEPASVLLARIRATRDNATSSPRKRHPATPVSGSTPC